MPLADSEAFARRLDVACDRVIVDHYLMGDGSRNGWRTKRTTFASRLEEAEFSAWNTLAKLWEIRELLAGMLGEESVLVGCDGFNSVGRNGVGSDRASLRAKGR